ncbi:carboxylesterase/lipase family protein [Mycobacterium sp. CVI_P3]|uniref:Carboxylic ester hydrolase n=1 Tax=Mycobacterium pinniadriaticum TaxID=2994102 RepID=A0ABT3S9E4_9MYCO|nr:carboxylesterase/lipase family protein [Mycobacterium pinniadriaticum]MCX2929696.1 carboxylesterase/lipase family protein [Mycobacterium pinniadriaticum]MCX2936120.1 carboxylesterase/lipase family protein [Mycobacterium pinniadriaticum]
MTADANIRQVVGRPVVKTGYGPVRGADDGRVATWKGIRYAAAPVGDLRWRAPAPPQPWTDVQDATAFGPVSPQPRSPIPMGLGTRADEDCLFLNIWAPSDVDAADSHPKPVMVWVHGGAYIFGSGSQPLYDGSVLADGSDVVVVTINYRLGALGFLDFSSAGFDSNIALRDVLAALRWVRDNIAGFGGDPDRVTLFGESAGAGIVTTLLAVPAAAGLFSRAIAQSSPATSIYDSTRASSVAHLVLDRLGMTAAEAHRAPVEALVDASMQVFDHVPTATPGRLAFAPTVDGDLVPDYPVTLARTGKTHPVPLLIGTNKDEAALFRFMRSPLMPIAPKAIRTMFEEIADDQPGLQLPTAEQIGAAYPARRARTRSLGVASDMGFRMPSVWFAEGHSAVAPVYLYRFDWATPIFKLIRLGAAHATELIYVWGNLVAGPRDVTFKLGGRNAGEALSDRMRTRWTNFAATGVPTGPQGQPRWAPYSAGGRTTLVMDRQDEIVDDLDRQIRLAWGDQVLSFR